MARLIRTEKEVEGRYEEVWLVVEEDALEQWPAGPLEVVGRPLATIVALHRRRASLAVGQGLDVDVLAIGPELDVMTGRRRFERLGQGRWRVSGGASGIEVQMDDDGLPTGGIRWPLEPD